LVTRITTIAAEMVVPALLGFWADGRLGTVVVFTTLGGAAGLALGIRSLLQLAAALNRKPGEGPPPQRDDRSQQR
jgi:hypothetical protein